MKEVDHRQLVKRPRLDGRPGWEEITPTTMRFAEADGSDIRIHRVRIFDPDGSMVHSYLRDEMGVRFKDNLEDVEDNLDYLSQATG